MPILIAEGIYCKRVHIVDTELVKYGNRDADTGIRAKSRKKRLFARAGVHTALTEDERQLIDEALKARDEWLEAGINFDYVCDELMVDYYIYRMKACESRYTYLLRLAKEKGLSHYILKT